jgi:hypothetical protein
MMPISIADAFKTGFDFDASKKKSFSTNNQRCFNTDVISFMFNIAPKHSISNLY